VPRLLGGAGVVNHARALGWSPGRSQGTRQAATRAAAWAGTGAPTGCPTIVLEVGVGVKRRHLSPIKRAARWGHGGRRVRGYDMKRIGGSHRPAPGGIGRIIDDT
jgi:hypothetical protein